MDKEKLLRENRDELTGLMDKQAFYVLSQDLIDNADEDILFAFIFFDMDNFKLYNANYGFEKGDELLVAIGEIVNEVFSEQLVARFSGDHFVVCTQATQVIPSIIEIRKRVKGIQKNINLELKAGVYVLDGETKDVVRCSDRARTACVSIKKKYDVDYRFYDEELEGSLKRKQFILDNLDEALANGYIQVYYQPIVRGLTGKICAWEALVRWIDPERGVVYPNEFISVLEEYRLIHKLDCYVMERVIEKFSAISKENRQEAVPVSINLSRLDFEAIDIVPYIDELIERYEANKSMFTFEITESVLMENPRFIEDQILRLRTKGYGVWMDDFGSGYSSLNVLKNFDFDLVKIDMEFLRGFEDSDDGKIIIKHMVSMLKNLGFHTLAEGVETQEQMDFLKDLGCELIQGYLIGRPMPFDEAVSSLDKARMKYELKEERIFLDTVGKIDVLRQNPLEGDTKDLLSDSLPLAIGIVTDGIWHFVYVNDGYKKEIRVHGDAPVTIVEEMINDDDWHWVQRMAFWELCSMAKATKQVRSMEFADGGRIINMRIRHIATDEENDSDAYMVSLRSLSNQVRDSYAFENILKLVPAGIFWKDKDRRFVGANQMFLDYYGLNSVDDIIGKTDEDMGWHINPYPFMKDELDILNKGITVKNVQGECIVKGQVRKIVASKQPFIVDGNIIGIIGFFNDVTKQEEEKEKLERLSNTDELTSLPNRRAYDTIVEKYIQSYNRDKSDFVMFMMDIDKFKQINDMYGHDFGDEVLKTASEIIRKVTSNNSVAFRIGGDEFAILHQFKSEAEIKSIKQEIEISFAQVNRIAGMDIKIKASIGVSIYSQAKDVKDLISIADKEMYEEKDKHKRKNR